MEHQVWPIYFLTYGYLLKSQQHIYQLQALGQEVSIGSGALQGMGESSWKLTYASQ